MRLIRNVRRLWRWLAPTGPGGRRALWLRATVVFVFVGAQVLVFGSPAQAVTTVQSSGGTITITGGPGHFNNITINQVGGNFTITDTGEAFFDLDLPCFLSGTGVSCPVSGVNRIVVNAGDLSDRITNNATVSTTLNGGDGNDIINAGPTPSLNVVDGGNGNDTLNGGSGADIMTGGFGTDVINGGGGVDSVDYGYYTAGGTVLVQLDGIANDGPPDENDNVNADVEDLFGSPGNDIISGTAASNVIDGKGGNDLLVGGAGNDQLVGGPGDDSLYGAEGNDTIAAKDEIRGNDYVSGGPDVDGCTGDTNDFLTLCEH